MNTGEKKNRGKKNTSTPEREQWDEQKGFIRKRAKLSIRKCREDKGI